MTTTETTSLVSVALSRLLNYARENGVKVAIEIKGELVDLATYSVNELTRDPWVLELEKTDVELHGRPSESRCTARH